MACLAVLALALSHFDPTQILGISRWFKPAKFAASIAVYLATLAFLIAPLSNRFISVRAIRYIAIFTMIGEIALIFLQSIRNQPSHFNTTTLFNDTVFKLMGVLILINTLAAGLVLREYVFRPPLLHPAIISSIRAGVAIFIVGSLQGLVMVGHMAHTVGAPDGGPGLPFLNWSTSHGDLRVAHFLALHALQGIPIAGVFLKSVVAVRIIAAIWFCAFLFFLIQALRGRPAFAA
jgi:hypothetical protein